MTYVKNSPPSHNVPWHSILFESCFSTSYRTRENFVFNLYLALNTRVFLPMRWFHRWPTLKIEILLLEKPPYGGTPDEVSQPSFVHRTRLKIEWIIRLLLLHTENQRNSSVSTYDASFVSKRYPVKRRYIHGGLCSASVVQIKQPRPPSRPF